ncbi:MAG: DMT family transporter [Leptospiraceae bacterium]|nr:DMT family transporter [Leptospiraceae bacterium]MCP5498876.1 DMT family transporter [Leptospiraceae bacterium]
MGQTETKTRTIRELKSKDTEDKDTSSNFKLGITLVLIASLMLSFQNVVTKVILSEKHVFGIFTMGGILKPSMGNSLLLMILRMVVTLPVMAFIVAPKIHKNTWVDIKSLIHYTNRGRLIAAFGSAMCLFASQFFIYLALGSIPTGVATTIFFVYPTITILLVWIFFGEKPPLSLVFAMLTIYIGGFLTIPITAFEGRTGGIYNYPLGATTGVLSGICFAGYMVLIKQARMHPVPFTIVSFSTILVAGSLMLPLFHFHVESQNWIPLAIGVLILGLTTLVGYLLNNFGVPLIGPSLTSVIGSSGPAMTAFMAYFLIAEKLNLYQALGVFLVTLWVLGISVENMKKTQKPPAPK